MGIYVSKYIEYRTKDGKWHLLESFVPKTDENSDYNENTPTVETLDSRLLYRNSEHMERLGHWNAFLYSGRNESPFEGRGLPEDMSDELRQIMDGVKEDSLEFKDGTLLDNWLNESFTKIVVSVEGEKELLELEKELQRLNEQESKLIPYALITDNGKTVFHGVPTVTCLGIGPYVSEEIDKITGNLPLL